jgi:hypothetical protein
VETAFLVLLDGEIPWKKLYRIKQNESVICIYICLFTKVFGKIQRNIFREILGHPIFWRIL